MARPGRERCRHGSEQPVTASELGHQRLVGLAATGGRARIVLGGRFGEEPAELSWRRLDRFAEAGGRIVDTAHSYADGRSEQVIGEWLRANAGSLAVVDKVAHPDDTGAIDLSPRAVRREVAESRTRLGVSTLDVVLLHRDSAAVPVQEVAETLAGLAADGEAREIGVSNWPASRLDQLANVLAAHGHVPVVSYQRSLAVPTTPLWPGTRHADASLLRVAARHGLPVLAWAAQARGFFTGTTEPPCPGQPDPFDSTANRARRQRCRHLARKAGTRPETVALAWLLHQPDTYPIIGPRSIAELDASLEATQLHYDSATLRWLAEGDG